MKLVVFGGGGFIGSAICERLLQEGHQLRIFERPRVPPYRHFAETENVEWTTGDFSSSHDLKDAVEGMDGVVHLVSTTLPKSSNDDPVYDVQTNIIPSLHMLNAMVEHKVKRIVFISSGGTVYGNPQYIPIDEKHPTEPVVSYGITKLAIEKYLHMFSKLHGIKAVTLRVANPYGERQRVETAQGAIGIFMHNILKGAPIEIWGDGNVQRDYIHVSDVAEAFAKAITYEGEKECFNISSGTGTSLNELIDMMKNIVTEPVQVIYKPGRSFDIDISVLCNQQARNELGWEPKVTMQDGLVRTAEWMKQVIHNK
ncbi:MULTISPECIES: NAD-dependent epimerase/dehydratase family protein [Enterobacter]|jgi:Nucleoside-diphosphate-sugar epimerases|uniref:NAD-dependent epimerase/dehydratase family protein n=1 Tax=Enterobacter TaxID=547 RepID=UPI00084FB07A|nr:MULTISPECIES: NAD-dependent epimerase/dehydratase family protein [Enterobacter]EKU2857793.1 NAD-dependent epimerase/dehydratase family protein [Enterobacter roggenkampii]MCM7166036.1 NAD-dependent epimerase/dehydratase family protein [Enterobacter quasiroggenkampii]MCU6321633.1 NAD-dependent epimerase/dehydratase family protein [Enterobacter quasiroggenkampii]MCU6358298.1 NAD-dependent epimerase/dehydratase family protein [Enterobacter quasiroggenkampii]OEI70286.1 NAD-dependent epimerase [E